MVTTDAKQFIFLFQVVAAEMGVVVEEMEDSIEEISVEINSAVEMTCSTEGTKCE